MKDGIVVLAIVFAIAFIALGGERPNTSVTVRDAGGRVIGYIDGTTVRDSNRGVLGYIKNGKTYDKNNRLVATPEVPGILFCGTK